MTEGALEKLAEFGILPNKGITLVEHDILTQALARVAVDDSISGESKFPSNDSAVYSDFDLPILTL